MRSNGYEVERHWTITEDGYILGMFRMPPKSKSRKSVDDTDTSAPPPVVFLNHALLDSSFSFIANGPGKALAYLL